MAEDTMSGLIYADDFAGIPETLQGLQEHIVKALEHSTKWRVPSRT